MKRSFGPMRDESSCSAGVYRFLQHGSGNIALGEAERTSMMK